VTGPYNYSAGSPLAQAPLQGSLGGCLMLWTPVDQGDQKIGSTSRRIRSSVLGCKNLVGTVQASAREGIAASLGA